MTSPTRGGKSLRRKKGGPSHTREDGNVVVLNIALDAREQPRRSVGDTTRRACGEAASHRTSRVPQFFVSVIDCTLRLCCTTLSAACSCLLLTVSGWLAPRAGFFVHSATADPLVFDVVWCLECAGTRTEECHGRGFEKSRPTLTVRAR